MALIPLSPGQPGVSSWTAWHWWEQVLAKIGPEGLWVHEHPPFLWMAPSHAVPLVPGHQSLFFRSFV